MLVLALLAGVGLTACGSDSRAGTSSTPNPSIQASRTGHHRRHAHRRRRRPVRRHRRRVRRHGGHALVASTASAGVFQSQPAARSCHARGSGPYARPDPACTPGAINPAVTQATIDQTICVSGWTETVRPPESVTESEKRASLLAYGDSGPLSDYEYDHLVPLELGGAVNDPRNLWPEPGGTPNPKDAVENELRRLVCARQMSLARAQRIMATNWVSWVRGAGG